MYFQISAAFPILPPIDTTRGQGIIRVVVRVWIWMIRRLRDIRSMIDAYIYTPTWYSIQNIKFSQTTRSYGPKTRTCVRACVWTRMAVMPAQGSIRPFLGRPAWLEAGWGPACQHKGCHSEFKLPFLFSFPARLLLDERNMSLKGEEFHANLVTA